MSSKIKWLKTRKGFNAIQCEHKKLDNYHISSNITRLTHKIQLKMMNKKRKNEQQQQRENVLYICSIYHINNLFDITQLTIHII